MGCAETPNRATQDYMAGFAKGDERTRDLQARYDALLEEAAGLVWALEAVKRENDSEVKAGALFCYFCCPDVWPPEELQSNGHVEECPTPLFETALTNLSPALKAKVEA